MITKPALDVAIAEAKRFLEKSNELRNDGTYDYGHYAYGKQTAAVKRASMDLSRALVKVRE